MNKDIFVLWILSISLSLCACGGKTNGVVINYGESEIYSDDEINLAVEVVKAQFEEFEGCELHTLSYAGDSACKAYLAYCCDLDENKDFVECIVFNSSFHSPKNGGGAWEADYEYTWSWYLAREKNGSWTLLTFGY